MNYDYKKIKLIAIDMDGTTYKTYGGPIKENIEPILAVQKKGIKAIFATGRPIYNVLPESIKYNMDSYGEYLIAYNGASIWNLNPIKEVKRFCLDEKLVDHIFQIANKYDIDVWCYCADNKTIVTNFDTKGFEETALLTDDIKVDKRDKDGNFKVQAYKLLVSNKSPEDEAHQLISLFCKKHGLNTSRGVTPLYEVNASNINKGIALEWLANKLNLKSENVMAIGDGENDIPMFKYAGFSVVMDNAKPNVKAFGDEITDSNVNAGAGKVIKKYFLSPENK